MENIFEYLWNDRKMLLTLFGVGFFCLIVGFSLGRISKGNFKPEKIAVHDTVYVDKPIQLGGTLEATKTIVEEKKPVKALPAITTFKVSDWVCAWDRWSGVIIDMKWNKTETLILYNVQTYSDEDGWNSENWYYDTEISAGKCN